MTAETIKMIKDADRLGQRCITQVHEKTVNKRLARALGFCVLRIAFMMKTQWFNTKSHHWFTAFDEIKTILQFADMRKQIKFNCVDLISKCNQKSKNDKSKYSSQSKESKNSCHFLSPTYYIMKNGRISARFGFLIEKVFNQIKQQFPSQKVESFEDVYQSLQDNYVSEAKLEVNETTLDLPQIILKYNGIYGFDLCLKPLTDFQSWKIYDTEIRPCFFFFFLRIDEKR